MSRPASGGAIRGRIRRRRLAIAIPVVLVLAFAAIAVVSAGSAVAHPSEGQPCSCHSPSTAATVTLKASVATIHPGKSVKLSGTVATSPTWTSVKLQKRKGTAAWKTFKTATLSSAAYSASWKAPTVKGTYKFRTIYLGDNHLKKGISPTRTVKVN